MTARTSALLIGGLGLAALIAQYIALAPPLDTASVAGKLWAMAGYFTILTNLGVTLVMLAVAAGWRLTASRAAGLLVALTMVGLVFHTLLAQLISPQGLAWWANQGLHSAMPIALALWWLAFAPKSVALRDLPFWLIWPGLYGAYALIRGAATGFWPYPFLNADTLGWPAVTLNIAALLAAFAVLSLGLIALTHLLRRS